jgi:dihydroxyacetone kinase
VVSDTPLVTGILVAAAAVDLARAELGRLDGAAGDGDHGMSMSIGVRNVRRRLAALPPDAAPADVLGTVARAMGDVGGAIGPLYAAALTAIADDLASPGWVAATDVARLRRAAEAAESAIVDLGHASVGDKTLVDALHAVAVALRDAEAGAADLPTAIAAAADAAERGAASTADMVARIGRASRLGERSRGLPDAGATSLAIIIAAMADAHRGEPAGRERATS